MNRFEPAKSNELGDAASIVTVRLDSHRGEGSPDVAGFKNRDLEAFFTQTNEEPFRELPRFEADVLNLTSLVSYELRNALRITLNLSFLDYDTALINDADTG